VSDLLQLIFRRLEIEPPVFYSREIQAFGPSADLLVRLGVLREIAPASVASCTDCGGGHQRRVEYISDCKTEAKHGYINCPECGVVEVSPDSLKRWCVDLPRFLRVVFGSAGVSGPASELVPGRLWRVGKVGWAGRSREVYFGRCYRRDDGHALTDEMLRRPKAILFVPTEESAGRWGGATKNLVVAIESCLAIDDQSVDFDVDYVEARLADAGLAGDTKSKRPTRKRADRAAKIEALENELIAHVRAARDHAYATKDRTGTPELLPRPTQKLLAKLAGVTESDVSRCLKDSAARELRLLWEIALDLDRIMCWETPLGNRRRA